MALVTFEDLPSTNTPINANNLNNNFNELNKENIYSTSEVDTGKKWIDGKPIYRKCFNITAQDTQHNISNLKNVIFESAIIKRNNYYGYADMSHYVVIQSNKIWLINDALDYASYGIILTIEYTKTTD